MPDTYNYPLRLPAALAERVKRDARDARRSFNAQVIYELDRKRRKANPKLKPEDDRDNGAYLDSLGWVLFKKKQHKEAKEVLLKAVEDKNAQHIEIYDHLGDVYLALGEREAAIKAYQRGLECAGESRREQERKADVEKKLEKLNKK